MNRIQSVALSALISHGIIDGFLGSGLSTAAIAGGSSPVIFHDVTHAYGLAGYRAQSGDGHGPGAVFADLDRDGDPDLYLVRAWGNANRLYINDLTNEGTRRYLSVDIGAGDTGNATGAIAGDYDNDGDLDLYVTNFDQPNVLLRNLLIETGTLAFTDVTDTTDPTPGFEDDQHGVGIAYYEGIALDNSLTAAWSDVDRDGDLDLYVGNHNGFWHNPVEGPYDLPGRRDVFYLNHGDGTFSDATMIVGVPGFVTATGATMTMHQRYSSTNAVIFADLDNDRWPDLLVTNKVGGPDDRDMLYRNRGTDGTGAWQGFQLVTYDLQPTFGARSSAAMGVDVADIDHDGDLDVYITDWSNLEAPSAAGQNDLWLNRFAETGTLAFEHDASLPAAFSWGAQWQDFDLDGHQELHVSCQNSVPDRLYVSGPSGYSDIAEPAGVAHTGNGRTCVTADVDRDGWPDLFVVNLDHAPSTLYINDSRVAHPAHRHLVLRLVGDHLKDTPPRTSRDALGARVLVRADVNGDGVMTADEHQLREVLSGSSNAASTSSLEVEFGVGLATTADVAILWPSGRRSDFTMTTNAHRTIDERLLVTGDIDGDHDVDLADVQTLLGAWGSCFACPSDLDGSGVVDFADLLVLLSYWG